ncbi:unnamed protein product, partial [Brassica rapa subsp. trilocularis]
TLTLALLLIVSPPLCNSADLIAASHRRRNSACSTYRHDNWRRYGMRLNRRVGFNAIINSSPFGNLQTSLMKVLELGDETVVMLRLRIAVNELGFNQI